MLAKGEQELPTKANRDTLSSGEGREWCGFFRVPNAPEGCGITASVCCKIGCVTSDGCADRDSPG